MSFFAGFVNGVFQGKDWREAKNDRERARKIQDEQLEWDREDREWTGEARGRQRTEWSQADQDRARVDRERSRTESQRDAELEAWNQTADAMTGQNRRDEGISIAGLATSDDQGEVAAPQSRRDSIPATEDRALGVMGFSDQSGPGGQIMQDRFADSVDRRETARNTPPYVPDQANNGPENSPPRTIAANMPPQAQAAPQGLSGPALEVEQRNQTPQGVAPAPQAAPPVDQAPAPQQIDPAATQPAARRVSAVPQNGSAMQDAAQGRGQGFSDYTEATRGFRSDAPQRIETPRQAPASPEAQARAISLADIPKNAASAVANAARGGMQDFAAFGGDVRAAGREGMGVASALGGNTEGAAASFDRADELRQGSDAHFANRAAAQQPAPAPGAATAAPGVPAGQPTGPGPRRAAPEVSGAQPTVVSGASDALPRTEAGTPMGSSQAVSNVASRAGISVARAANGQSSPAEVRRATDQAAEATVREYRSNQMPPIVEHYIRTGQIDKARAFETWMQERSVQEGMRSWARAMHSFNANDFEGMLEGLIGAYEARDYYDDGLTVVREGTRLRTNPQTGEVIGAEIVFRDSATGRTFRQEINGLRDMVAIGFGALAPEAAFDKMWDATFGGDQASSGPTQAEQLAVRKQAVDEATKTAPIGSNPTPEQIDAIEQRLLGRLGGGVGGGEVPLLAD